jgi:RNA polymerase sigma factor (sigma-70 family)
VHHAVCDTRKEGTLVPETNIDFGRELACGFAASHIRRQAKSLVRQLGSNLVEAEDVQQELTLRLIECLPAFDPRQGCFNAFVKLVVNRDAVHLKRKCLLEKQQREDECSLSALVADADGCPQPLGNVIGQPEQDARTGNRSRRWVADTDQAHDLDATIASMSSELRYVATLLKEESTADVARRLRCSRTTVYSLISKIRKQFAAKGLGTNLVPATEHVAPLAGSYPSRRAGRRTSDAA